MLTAVKMAHYLLQDKLRNVQKAVDATAGNGKDTLFLAANTPAAASIWAFDIQENALHKTKQLLQAHGVEHKVELVLDSHVNILNYCRDLDVVMFNLGYLPGGRHYITTQTETTLQAVANSLALLRCGGVVTIASYSGHDEGKREQASLETFIKTLAQAEYTVAQWRMLNQVNQPPVLYVIEKLRGDQRERTAPF